MSSTWRSVLAGLLFAAAFLLLVPAGRATERIGKSPHAQPDGCPACHDASAGAAPGAVRPVIPTCLGCHPDADMHPVGMAPREVKVADGWPLENGKVTCATCHAEPSCDRSRGTVRPWFRGGNPERKLDFCYRCHTPTAMQRTNPHVPTEQGGSSEGCSACHSGKPAEGATVAESRLRVAPEEACVTCHPGAVHAGVAEHLGAILGTPLTADDAKHMPLGEGGKIECWTCHDVHQTAVSAPVAKKGVAARIDAAMQAEAAKVVPAEPPKTEPAKTEPAARPSLLALPTSDGRLCTACHGKGP